MHASNMCSLGRCTCDIQYLQTYAASAVKEELTFTVNHCLELTLSLQAGPTQHTSTSDLPS